MDSNNAVVLRMKNQLLSLNAYDRHKKLINDYLLCRKGATALLKRDTSKDKRDIDVIRENHKFLWEEEEEPKSWGENLAKKYYDKLFKEYCISDLSRYKENKIALRWRTENEVVDGKGQFTCGSRRCDESEKLRTWEVNFAYIEGGDKKNALVKLRLCPSCSEKLNYRFQKKEIIKKKRKRSDSTSEIQPKKKRDEKTTEGEGVSSDETVAVKKEKDDDEEEETESGSNIWKTSNIPQEEEKSRDKEFEDYLEDLFM